MLFYMKRKKTEIHIKVICTNNKSEIELSIRIDPFGVKGDAIFLEFLSKIECIPVALLKIQILTLSKC